MAVKSKKNIFPANKRNLFRTLFPERDKIHDYMRLHRLTKADATRPLRLFTKTIEIYFVVMHNIAKLRTEFNYLRVVCTVTSNFPL